MSTRIQVALGRPGESLQIPYPSGYKGSKVDLRATEIRLNHNFRLLTADEVAVAEAFLGSLPYSQTLLKGAYFIDPNDPLLAVTHDELDRIERQQKLSNTRRSPNGGERSIRERVLIIRESYQGSGQAELSPAH